MESRNLVITRLIVVILHPTLRVYVMPACCLRAAASLFIHTRLFSCSEPRKPPRLGMAPYPRSLSLENRRVLVHQSVRSSGIDLTVLR